MRDSVFHFSRLAGNYYSFLEGTVENYRIYNYYVYDLNFEPYLPPTYNNPNRL